MRSGEWTKLYLSIFISFLFSDPLLASEKKEIKNDAKDLIGEIGITDKGDKNTNSLYLSFSIPPEDWRERILDFVNRWRDDKELRARFTIGGRKIEIWSPRKGDTSLYEKEMKAKGSILIVVGNPGQSAIGTSPDGNGIRGGDGQDIRVRVDNGSIGIAVAQTGGAGSDGKDDFFGSGGSGGDGGDGGNATVTCETSDTNVSGYTYSGEGGPGGKGGNGEAGGTGGKGGWSGIALVILRNDIPNPEKGKDFGTMGMAVSAFGGRGGSGGNGGMTGGRGGNVGSSSAAEATAFVATAISMGSSTRMPGGGGNADGQIPGARAGNGGDALKAQKAKASGGSGKVFDFDGNQSFKSGAFAKGGDSANGSKGGDALPAGHGGNGGNGADGGDAAASNRSEEKNAIGGKLGFGGPAGQPNGQAGLNGQSNGQEEYF